MLPSSSSPLTWKQMTKGHRHSFKAAQPFQITAATYSGTGLNAEHWGTPLFTSLHCVIYLFTPTLCFLFNQLSCFLWTGHYPLLINPPLMEK